MEGEKNKEKSYENPSYLGSPSNTYARKEVADRAAVSGGESRDAGGDGYGGNITVPFCGVGAVMSMRNGTCILDRTGEEANVSSERALDTAKLSSAGGRS